MDILVELVGGGSVINACLVFKHPMNTLNSFSSLFILPPDISTGLHLVLAMARNLSLGTRHLPQMYSTCYKKNALNALNAALKDPNALKA